MRVYSFNDFKYIYVMWKEKRKLLKKSSLNYLERKKKSRFMKV